MTSKYNSPFSIGKRQTIYIDPNDPRVRGYKAGITASRLGAELEIVDFNGIYPAGIFSYLKGASKSPRENPGISPLSQEGGLDSSFITNLDANWIARTLSITFDFDFSDESNQYIVAFQYRLRTASFTPDAFIRHTTLNKNSTLQTINFTLDLNRRYFGPFQGSFSLLEIRSVDSFGNLGDIVTLSSIPEYSSSLPAPIITVVAINQGYTVDWQEISEEYQYISIEEVVSDSSTDPGTGYTQIYLDNIKPAIIIRPTLQSRWVRARFADEAGQFGDYSAAQKVTPVNPVTVDNVGPSAPASGSVTADIDNSAGATIGFNAYLDISWSAVSDSTLRGYRIRFRENGTTDPYSYVDSPGTETSFRLNGLSIGTVYEVAIASYDEFNNTSSAYFSIGTAQATGTPFIGKNVTTVGYFGASATGDTGTFKFGYGVQDSGGTKRGLVFNSNNYWYIDSAQSALFKLGGNTSNYIEWDGETFIVQGDLRAQKGQFDGNVEIKSGGSLFSGTLDIGGNLTGAGFIINKDGLTFSSSNVPGTTIIDGDTGLLTTISANIGGWKVDANTISQTSNVGTVTLDSLNAQIILNSTDFTAGIATPNNNSSNDIIFWSGGARNTSANFYVTANGAIKSNGSFSFANNIISGTGNTVDFDLSLPNNLRFLNMPSSDDDGFAGDPTLTLRSDNKIVRGRRLIYTDETADAGRTTTINPTTKEGTILINEIIRTVKVGDLLFIDE
jgi:hypothetical protein